MSDTFFTESFLTKIFDDRIKKKSFKGIDKIRPTQFEKNKEVEIKRIADRYKNEDYKFIPYLEILRNKGRNKAPRMISSPTVRDKIILTALKEYLHRQFPESVPNKLANCVVRELKQKIDSNNYRFYYRTDIKSFYDEINRTRLLDFLTKKVTNPKAIKVLKDSIENVTIPHNESKRNSKNYVTVKGIPQGLPISNILAQIYLKKIDNNFSQNNICYFRFVDDIIILTKYKPYFTSLILKFRLYKLGLKLNKDKSQIGNVSTPFSFLGYQFKGTKLTLSEKQISKFITRISGKFTWFKRGIENPESRPDWLIKDVELFKESFINELNEKITGAKAGKKRYGWLFYFIEIDDLTLLYRIDTIIRNQFKNLDDFGNKPSKELKSIVKAYFDIKYKNGNNYVHNYNDYETVAEKRRFLVSRGKLNPTGAYTKEQIERAFERYKNKRISILDKDIGYY